MCAHFNVAFLLWIHVLTFYFLLEYLSLKCRDLESGVQIFLHRVGGPLLMLSFSHGKCLLSAKLVKEKLGTKHKICIEGLLQNNDGF